MKIYHCQLMYTVSTFHMPSWLRLVRNKRCSLDQQYFLQGHISNKDHTPSNYKRSLVFQSNLNHLVLCLKFCHMFQERIFMKDLVLNTLWRFRLHFVKFVLTQKSHYVKRIPNLFRFHTNYQNDKHVHQFLTSQDTYESRSSQAYSQHLLNTILYKHIWDLFSFWKHSNINHLYLSHLSFKSLLHFSEQLFYFHHSKQVYSLKPRNYLSLLINNIFFHIWIS